MTSPSSPTRRDLIKSATVAAAAVCVPAGMAMAAAKKDKKDAADKAEKKEGQELVGPLAPVAAHPQWWHGLKIGCASYTFRKLPLDQTIRNIQRVQLPWVSIKEMHLPLKTTTAERKEVAQKFRDAGINPISCGVVKEKDEAGWRNAFEYTRDIGAPVMVVMCPADHLPILDKLVKEFGDIKIAIHNHGPEDKVFPSPFDVMKAVESLDPRVGLCIDVGHTARAKADPVKAIRELKERLYDVHMKDISTVDGKGSSVEVELGRGVLDVKGMMQALVDIKFAGHVGFEHERDASDPLPGLSESIGYTKGVLAAMG